MAAQTDTPREYAIRAQGHDFTIEQLVKEEQLTCREPMELTFKLIGLSHYLSTDAKWKNERGEKWDLPRLIRAELAQPVNGAACGGTHRIMGLSYAVKKRKEAQKPVEGQWWRAEKFVNEYYKYAMSLQNRDGSFSSDWFKRRSDWGGNDRKLQTTGHILEWIVFASTDEQLVDDRITRSVAFLTNLMVQHRYHDWNMGQKGTLSAHCVSTTSEYSRRIGNNRQLLFAAETSRLRPVVFDNGVSSCARALIVFVSEIVRVASGPQTVYDSVIVLAHLLLPLCLIASRA